MVRLRVVSAKHGRAKRRNVLLRLVARLGDVLGARVARDLEQAQERVGQRARAALGRRFEAGVVDLRARRRELRHAPREFGDASARLSPP